MGIIKELWEFIRVRKKFVLLPIILVLMILGVIMVLGTNAGVLSPFIYFCSNRRLPASRWLFRVFHIAACRCGRLQCS